MKDNKLEFDDFFTKKDGKFICTITDENGRCGKEVYPDRAAIVCHLRDHGIRLLMPMETHYDRVLCIVG